MKACFDRLASAFTEEHEKRAQKILRLRLAAEKRKKNKAVKEAIRQLKSGKGTVYNKIWMLICWHCGGFNCEPGRCFKDKTRPVAWRVFPDGTPL